MQKFSDLETCVDAILRRAGKRLVVGAPLGLGKPPQLLNALYRRAQADPGIRLTICTALSLEIPRAKSELERRFLEPFAARYFAGVPEFDYARDRRAGRLPVNVEVLEFFFSPGSQLGHPYGQQHYVSSNYTHAARDTVERGVNVLFQMIAVDGPGAAPRYSLSSNPDLTLDIVPPMRARAGEGAVVVGQINRQLPFMPNDAEVPADFFNFIVDAPELDTPLFAVPNPPAPPVAHAVGLQASTLIRDGGTLQVGIGELGDSFAHALRLRHTDNAGWRRAIAALDSETRFGGIIERDGGYASFETGLYAASEMFTNGLFKLYQAGVLKRRVYDDLELQSRLNRGEPVADAEIPAFVLHGAFFLGPADFYAGLRALAPEERALFNMTAVSNTNDLFGNEALQRLQRVHARFVNICMKVTLLGAATADTLEGGQVVSGVGGQYNFIAMAHELKDARAIQLLRSTRTGGDGVTTSNIVWEYGQCTIPRHLRDIVVTEYGSADLRGRTDAECCAALINIADSRFQSELLASAQRAGKLPREHVIPETFRNNTPETLARRLAPLRAAGLLPEFPLGTDFTPEEQLLVWALTALKTRSAGWKGKLGLLAGALTTGTPTPDMRGALERMALQAPHNFRERLLRRIVTYGLKMAARG